MALSNLLLISADPKDLAFATALAKVTKLSFHHATNAIAGVKILERNPDPMVILADVSTPELYQLLENTIQETIGLFSEKVDANRIHFISAHSLGKTIHLIESAIFGHFIERNYDNPAEAAETYGRVVTATLADRAFGLNHFLKVGTKIQTVQLISSSQKQSAVEAVRNYLLAAKFQNRIATLVANAVDELIMNSIFDAPVDEAGRPIFSAIVRNTLLKLEGKSSVEVQIGFDGKTAGITTIDHYGSLDKTKLLNHISKLYTQNEYKVKSAVAGAGIGLARIFQMGGGSLLFFSENSSRTEVTLLFKKVESFRDFRSQFHFLSTQFYF